MAARPLVRRRRQRRSRWNRLKPHIAKSGKWIFRLVKSLWGAPVGLQLGLLNFRSTVGNVTVGWLAAQSTPLIVHVAVSFFG